jgi:hypothetical protein
MHAPICLLLARIGGSAPRSSLTQALTGAALAARPKEHNRLNFDAATMGYLKGRVRGRTPRLGRDAHAYRWKSAAGLVERP